MPNQPRRSISRKLDRLVLVSVGLALAVAALLNLAVEAQRYVATKRESLQATAGVFAAASSRAVAAGDRAAVMQALRGIARVPGVIQAEVWDGRGTLLAELGTAVRLGSDLDLDGTDASLPLRLLTSYTVQTSVPVVDGGRDVGRLRLISDTGDLSERFRNTLLYAAGGFAIAIVIGLLLSNRLQRGISRPIIALADTMSSLSSAGAPVAHTGPVGDDETGLLASRFNEMVGQINRATAEIVAREEDTLLRLSKAAEERDDQTGQHILRVARVSRMVAEALGLPPEVSEDIYRASPMHDIGKISIPDAILFKPGKLDAEERVRMEMHAEAGYRILQGSSSRLVQLAAEIALSHHERWDGTGYPQRLAGAAIPLSGRITAVADVCDALLTARPYKQAWSFEKVRAFLVENAGSHFDPTCVEAIMRRWSDVEEVYRAMNGAPIMKAA